jgi:hypothetical protein
MTLFQHKATILARGIPKNNYLTPRRQVFKTYRFAFLGDLVNWREKFESWIES